MTADYHVDIGYLFRKNFILGNAFLGPRPVVWETNDHINLFILSEDIDYAFTRVHRIDKSYRFCIGRVFGRVFPHNTEKANFHTPPIDHDIFPHRKFMKRFFQFSIPGPVLAEFGIRGNQRRRGPAPCFHCAQHLRESIRIKIKIVVAQSDYIIS